jgi:hypothetical protein
MKRYLFRKRCGFNSKQSIEEKNIWSEKIQKNIPSKIKIFLIARKTKQKILGWKWFNI